MVTARVGLPCADRGAGGQQGSSRPRDPLAPAPDRPSRTTAAYDAAIAHAGTSWRHLRAPARRRDGTLPDPLRICDPLTGPALRRKSRTSGGALRRRQRRGIAGAEQLQGKELSYNNLVDLDAAGSWCRSSTQPAVAIIKHTNPCGCARAGATLLEAYRKALAMRSRSRPSAASSASIARSTRRPREEIAKTLRRSDRRPGLHARSALASFCRQEESAARATSQPAPHPLVVKSISGGYPCCRLPTPAQLDARRLMVRAPSAPPTDEDGQRWSSRWKVGQAREVERDRLRARRTDRRRRRGTDEPRGFGEVRRHESRAARLPAPWSPRTPSSLSRTVWKTSAKTGATAVIQPGGSVRDDEVIAAADRLGVAMVFTGVRHFRH